MTQILIGITYRLCLNDKILNPQTYLELMTKKYYPLNVDNQLEEVEKTLEKEFGEETFWSYSLADIPSEEHEIKLVPVEIVNITEDCKQDKFCRFFQVPDDWNIMEKRRTNYQKLRLI